MKIGKYFLLLILFSSFVLADEVSWSKEDCDLCEVSLGSTGKSGFGNSGKCHWAEESEDYWKGKVSINYWDVSLNYDGALDDLEKAKNSVKERDLAHSNNFEEREGETSYVAYWFGQYDKYYGYARIIEGVGYEYTLNVEEFDNMGDVKKYMDELMACTSELSKVRDDYKSISETVDKDEATAGSKGLDYLEENKVGGFFWNLRYWINQITVSETQFPWVEDAIEAEDAGECYSEEKFSPMWNCFFDKAVASQNHLLCEAAGKRREECYARVATAKEDPEVCDKIREYIKWGRKKDMKSCYRQYAAMQKNVDACDKMRYDDYRSECYEAVVMKTQDSSICAKLSYPDICYLCYVHVSNDTSICEEVSRGNKKYCNSRRAAEGCSAPIRRMFEYGHIADYGGGGASRG